MDALKCSRWKKIVFSALLAAAVIISMVPAQASAADNADFTTSYYNVNIDLKTNNTATITERIGITTTGYIHGIYRYIPLHQKVSYRDDGGNVIKTVSNALKVSDASVDDYAFDTYDKGGNFVIKVGDSDKFMSGKKNFRISYKVKMYDDRTSAYDSFYYNILPYDWSTSIPSSTVTVHMPKSVNAGNINVIAGESGKTKESSKVSWTLKGNTIVIKTKEALPQGTGITVGVMLPEGYFSNESSTAWMHYLQYGTGVILIILLILMLMKYGRDPKRIQTVEFEAPEGATPADVGYIIDGSSDKEDIVALLFYWANKGIISIEQIDGSKKSDFRLTKLMDLPEDSKTYEKTFFRGLFEGNDGTVLLSEMGEKAGNAFMAAKDELKGEFAKKNRVFTRTGNSARIGAVLLSVLGVMAPSFFLYIMFGNVLYFLLFGIAAVLLIVSYILSIKTYDKKDIGMREKLVPNIISGAILLVVCAFMVIGLWKMESDLIAGIVFAALAVAGYISSRYMRKRTKKGADLYARILGFKQFIQTAELDKLNMLIEEDPDYFYGVMPYAYVMGLSKKWAKKFENIDIRQPEWYSGDMSVSVMNSMMFFMVMDNFRHSFGRSIDIAVAPEVGNAIGGDAGSGGSYGGGGFSGGGGFGGGGGGSW